MSTAEKRRDLSLEERLQPWLDQGEYLIVFVIIVMIWSAITINLLGFALSQTAIGNDLPMRAVVALAFVLPMFAVWFYPIFSLKGLARARKLLAFLQRNFWINLPVFALFAILLISMDNRSIWSPYPLVQVCILILMALYTLVVLFMQPFRDAPFQLWRKIGIGLLVLLIAIELILHLLVSFQILPLQVDTGMGVSYGRVTSGSEGGNISRTNQYGWHYVDYRLDEEGSRILLHGDTFVQALEVPVEDHMGQVLEERLNQGQSESSVEVLAQGLPGYGSGMYLNDNLTAYIWEPLDPDEVIVFFHMVNDFQIDTALDGRIANSILTDNPEDRAIIRESDWDNYHNTSHLIIAGHDPVNPFETIISYSMILNYLRSWWGGRLIDQPLHLDEATAEQPFGAATVLYEVDQSSEIVANTYALTGAILADYVDAMTGLGVEVHLVTIPHFPLAFYEANSGGDWDVVLADFDLSGPERALQQMADELDIEFLGMLNYLRGTDVETLQSYFFNNGTGHLTVTGHQAFADAVYSCFYNDEPDARCERKWDEDGE